MQLRRTLGLWECVFFGVGAILGAGIYALVGKVAGMGGNMTWVSFTIASITALASAFSYAELSSMFPKAGGEYEYAKHALGKKSAFFLGSFISLNGIITGATVSLAFAGYLGRLIGIPPVVASIGILGLLFMINGLGIRESSHVNIVFTLIEIAGLLLVIVVASDHIGSIDYFEPPPSGVVSILSGAALSFFAYIGFEEIVKLAEETREPVKNIPKALFLASGITMLIYIAVSVCAVSAISWNELSKSESPLADIVESDLNNAGVIVIAVIALFSTSNTILSNMLGSSRVILYMTKETRTFKVLSFIHPRRQTPVTSLILVVLVMIAFALIGEIETVAFIANFFIFLTFLLVNISVIVLRFRKPDVLRPYRVPGAMGRVPIIPVIALVFTSILIGFTVYNLAKGVL